MALPGGDDPIYGIQLEIAGVGVGTTCTLQRDTNSGFPAPVTAGTFGGDTLYEDVLPNDGVTRYYRARVSKTGYTDSAWSSTVSGTPVRLNGIA